MNIRPLSLLLACAIALPLEGQTLSLDEAVERALANEPSVEIASADRDAAAAAQREARSATRPQVSLGASVFQYEEPMLVSPIHTFRPGLIPDFDETLIQSALSGSWLLWDAGAARSRVEQAEAFTESAAVGIVAVQQAIIANTVAAYLSVLTAREALAAEQQRIEAIESEVGRVELLKKVGRAANLEIYRVEAARAAAEAERTAAAARLEVSIAELQRMVDLPLGPDGGPALSPVSSPAPGNATSLAALETVAVDSNPRVLQARHRHAAQIAAVESAEAGRWPQINAAANVLEYGSSLGDFTFEWNAGLNLRFSAFDSGATTARIDRARAAEAQARAQVRAAEDEVRQALDRSWAELRQAEATVESVRTAEERFVEVARIEKLRLDVGSGTQTDYLRALADVAASHAALARARQRLALAHVELARAAGRLDREWVSSNLRSSE